MGPSENQIEIATVHPESVIETQDEITERERAAHRYYYSSHGEWQSGVSDYEAGWKAAKARYEVKE